MDDKIVEITEAEEIRISVLHKFVRGHHGDHIIGNLTTHEMLEIGQLHDRVTSSDYSMELRRLALLEKWVGDDYDSWVVGDKWISNEDSNPCLGKALETVFQAAGRSWTSARDLMVEYGKVRVDNSYRVSRRKELKLFDDVHAYAVLTSRR